MIDGRLCATIGSQLATHVAAEFVAGKPAHARRSHHVAASDGLLRAIGVRPGHFPLVFDAMAGLGRDGFALAEAGCRVVMCEQSPSIHALLADGLSRAAESPVTAEITARIILLAGDALDVMRDWPGRTGLDTPPDVVYLDPMYPGEPGKAAVKKESQLLRLIAAHSPHESEPAMLAAARTLASTRVVVKRPKSAPHFAAATPSGAVTSKSTRWDIYGVKPKD